ncbi:hypothetical protein E8E12_001709 [Didymella heteroderae]|uniref:Uncharacterized protein n=1 Tax=Didymella heteroderae TaxID=1769908 RepID=A0A9P4WL85_9PLEO|nr:hypothetical protein E8E12_001709 [Didymella heteroderae]
MLRRVIRDRNLTASTYTTRRELLQRLRQNDFGDAREYRYWQLSIARRLKVKIILHARIKDRYCYDLPAHAQFPCEQHLEARPAKIRASVNTADPVRESFVDLPGEARNLVYTYCLFGDGPPDKWEVTSVPMAYPATADNTTWRAASANGVSMSRCVPSRSASCVQ